MSGSNQLGAPKKEQKTQSRIRQMNPENANKLRRSGNSVAYMFSPNENVEPVNFTVNPTNYVEYPASAYREGAVTPVKQKKDVNPFGAVGQLPSEAYGGSRRRRTQRRTRHRRTTRRHSRKN